MVETFSLTPMLPPMLRERGVLLFIETGGPGGAERVVYTLATELAARGARVGVLTLRTGWLTEHLDQAGIERFQIESTRGTDLGLPWRIAKLIREKRYGVLHSHLVDSNFYGAIAARMAGVTHIATEHGDVHHINTKRFMNAKLRLCNLLGSRFTAVSHFTARHLTARGVAESRVSVVGNPIAMPAEAGNREAARQEVGADESCFVWVHVANFRKVKDQPTLLRAFKRALDASNRRQLLLLIGDGPERSELEQLAEELQLGEHLRFLGFRNDVHTWLAAADGFVLSSRSEAMPMSLLEAALFELVLVGTDVGGIGEVIRDGETGYLAPAGSPEGLASALIKAVSDPTTLGCQAGKEVRERFSVEAVLRQFADLYEARK